VTPSFFIIPHARSAPIDTARLGGLQWGMTSPSPSSFGPVPLQVAIDGPAGAGKSTVARQVARALDLTYVDTGAMYRALAWSVLEQHISPDNADAVCRLAQSLVVVLENTPDGVRVLTDGNDITAHIRTPEISRLTSPLSALPCVRTRMVALQQQMAARQGVVMEGRDIGTVVLPHAPVKVFLTASPHARALRRHAELAARGIEYSLADLEREIRERDTRDTTRDTSPLSAAPDAVLIDSDLLTADQVVARILDLAHSLSASPADATSRSEMPALAP